MRVKKILVHLAFVGLALLTVGVALSSLFIGLVTIQVGVSLQTENMTIDEAVTLLGLFNSGLTSICVGVGTTVVLGLLAMKLDEKKVGT